MGSEWTNPNRVSTSKGEQTFTASPELRAFNRLALNETEAGLRASGGASRFATAQPDLYTLNPDEESFRNLLMEFSRDPGAASTRAVSPYETAGLATLQGRMDPTARISAAQSMLNEIIGPKIMSQLTAAGQGRSGAQTEALSNAGLEMMLPILMSIDSAAGDFGRAQLGLGGALDSRAQGALGVGMGAASLPRELAAEDFARQQNFYQSLLSGIPITTEGTTTAKQRNEQHRNFLDTMGTLTSIAGASAGMCWIAEALWGPLDYRTLLARRSVLTSHTWMGRLGRFAYKRFGKAVARHQRVVEWFRPLFTRLAGRNV